MDKCFITSTSIFFMLLHFKGFSYKSYQVKWALIIPHAGGTGDWRIITVYYDLSFSDSGGKSAS